MSRTAQLQRVDDKRQRKRLTLLKAAHEAMRKRLRHLAKSS
jgi:hypothetical protein